MLGRDQLGLYAHPHCTSVISYHTCGIDVVAGRRRCRLVTARHCSRLQQVHGLRAADSADTGADLRMRWQPLLKKLKVFSPTGSLLALLLLLLSLAGVAGSAAVAPDEVFSWCCCCWGDLLTFVVIVDDARMSQRELVEGGYVPATHPHAICDHKAKHKRPAALQRSQQALY